jgi:hypothetical protein
VTANEVATTDANTSDQGDAPEPRIRGRFSLYDLPDGGIHIAWLPNGAEDSDTQHFEIPGQVLKIAKMASEGKLNPAEMAKHMMGGMFG